MILSMTGFATAQRNVGGCPVTVDLRSVNHRYLEFQLRAPDEVRPLEGALRDAVAAQLTRGKVECRVAVGENLGDSRNATPDISVMEQLAAHEQLVKGLFPHAAGLSVKDVLTWPGVLAKASVPGEVLAEAVQAAAADALAELTAARQREGAKLAQFMLERVARIEKLVEEARPLTPQAVAAFQAKLKERIAEAGGLSDERLQHEIVLFASRFDVEEELSRLGAHLGEVRRVIGKGGTAGKRLDFLMQELNREANTLGSKSVTTPLTNIAVELKVLIEQMREQTQNIE